MEESSKPLIQRGSCVCACGGGGGGGGARGGQVVVPSGGTEELMVDLEKGQQGHRHRHREEDPPQATAAADARFAMEQEIQIAANKAIKCIARVLIILPWIYLVDWMRRYITTHSTEELMLTICPLGTLIVAVSVFLFILMGCVDECMDEHVHPTNNST